MKQPRLILIAAMFLLTLPIALAGPVNATASRYDLTNSSNALDLYAFVVAVNDLTGQLFMTGIVLVSFVILLVALMGRGVEDALLGAGFITSVITILFSALNL